MTSFDDFCKRQKNLKKKTETIPPKNINTATIPTNTSKEGFFAARCNKDNFWNLMFFLTMFIGVGLAFLTKIMILSWIAIAGSIFLVKRNSNIIFLNEEKTFLINDSTKINSSGEEFIILMFATGAIIAATGFFLDSFKVPDSVFIMSFMASLVVLIPTLYCFIRNIPIAVFFKKEAWIGDGKYCRHCADDSDSRYDDMRRSPMYDYMPGNIWHSNYRRRHK